MKLGFTKIARLRPSPGKILLFAIVTAVMAHESMAADNSFADIVRKTEPLTPDQEQKSFHLPPGFEIELVAAEPDIAKPINMAFDARGRLWVAQSYEYPFPAPADKPARDAIKILSEFNAHGRAQKVTTFADGLNIPIGIYPYKDGALGYSIPYIYQFRDTNGDGHADTKEIFLGRFGFERDTHGMTSSFRRGYDGWLYANHGYNNNSTLTARDGSSIQMNSGNTYRVKMDGSHIEQFTWGRVNPFGMVFDPLGNIYSADCETLPIYQLLRGAYYPSFGKPDDGLGFAPEMMNHKHGSTAIAGIVYYAATNFPPAFRDNIFVGNVMTCRIDRDSLEPHGSTQLADEEADFLSSDDPWFRPVDLQLGPNGAIYVADFYNRIIGHYEVPLTHPGRDRERGRIWRITYHGENADAKIPSPTKLDLSHASAKELIAQLANANLTVRMLATSELSDRLGVEAIKPVTKMMRSGSASAFQKIHGLWVLYRLNALDEKTLSTAARDADSRLRVHAMKVLSETATLTPSQHEILLGALHDPDAFVERAAADALGRHPQFENLRPLLDARERVPADDTHLLHVLRMALRDHLVAPGNFARLPLPLWSAMDEQAIADVCLGAPTAESAEFLLRHLEKHPESSETSAAYLQHAARYLPESKVGVLIDFARRKFKDDLDFQLTLFNSIQAGAVQRGGNASTPLLADWGRDIATGLTDALENEPSSWRNSPVPGMADKTNPWSIQERNSADGSKAERFLSSLPGGEKHTGILRSKNFTAPAQLKFFMAGHNGYPDKPDQKKNAVRLRAADTREILAESFPPRNDLAQPFAWDLSAASGKRVYMEIEDADDAAAYAWLAVGRFDPSVVKLPTTDPSAMAERKLTMAKLAASLKLANLEPKLAEWLDDKDLDDDTRAAAATALAAIHPDESVIRLARVARDPADPPALREKIAQTLASENTKKARAALVDALRLAPERLQVRMALALAGGKEGAEALLNLAERGLVSPRLLLQRAIKERVAAAAPENLAARLEKITQGLPPARDEIQKILDERLAGFNPAQADAALGAKTFTQNCAVCHSMDNVGGAVGPHLDGVGNRGLERLMEDVLDPNRNVDPSFRYSTVELKDGDVFAGLVRREEGATIVFVDATGKETSIPKANIEKRVESMSSLMPDNFSDAITVSDFNNLMAFLLSKGSGKTERK